MHGVHDGTEEHIVQLSALCYFYRNLKTPASSEDHRQDDRWMDVFYKNKKRSLSCDLVKRCVHDVQKLTQIHDVV